MNLLKPSKSQVVNMYWTTSSQNYAGLPHIKTRTMMNDMPQYSRYNGPVQGADTGLTLALSAANKSIIIILFSEVHTLKSTKTAV